MSDRGALPAGVTLLERGWLSSNNVVFTTGVTAVVDTGYVTHAAQTVSLVGAVLAGRPLERIVSTHLHSDHCGGNAALQAAWPGAKTFIPSGQADAALRWDEAALGYETTGQSCARFGFDATLGAGDTIELGERAWEVHAAPGHDPHSVILFQASSRVLISADALWENGFGVVFPELEGDEGFAQVASTLDIIDSLAPDLVLPGHGLRIEGNAAVSAALSRARSRLDRFVANPHRHAVHAVKVLLKFKLLELQSAPTDQFVAWALDMPFLGIVHARFFNECAVELWLQGLMDELAGSGALARRESMLYNV